MNDPTSTQVPVAAIAGSGIPALGIKATMPAIERLVRNTGGLIVAAAIPAIASVMPEIVQNAVATVPPPWNLVLGPVINMFFKNLRTIYPNSQILKSIPV